MGCDIHGWIEVKKYDWSDDWMACMDIKSIVGRNYSMFAALFGVRNYDQFNATAPERGLPENVSDIVKDSYEEWQSDAHAASWITIQEIKNIDWDECGTEISERIDAYADGSDKSCMSFIDSSVLTPADHVALACGEIVIKGNMTYKRNVAKKSKAKSSDWDLLFSIMEQLQNFYDEDDREDANTVDDKPALAPHEDTSRVRLVVWFDN